MGASFPHIIALISAAADANGEPDPFFTGPVIALTIGVLGAAPPLVIWFLNRMGDSGEIQKLNLHIKKIEIATKLKQLEKEFGDSVNLDWGPLKEEIADILSVISKEQKLQKIEKGALGHEAKKLSFLRRMFIWYKPVSIGSWIVHIYFYMMVFSIFSLSIVLMTGPQGAPKEIWFILPVYILIAYLLRKWAIHLLKKNAPDNKYFE